ncbi:MAG: ester cyclase [Pseudomonadota bacterium]
MTDQRATTRSFLNGIIACPAAEVSTLAHAHLTPGTVWDIAFPINRLEGIDAVVEGFILPLRRALSHCRRRDEIFIGGDNIREPGGWWCSAVTHYVGNFETTFCGLEASGRLAFLRAGEFFRVEDDGRISEAKIIFDLLDLMLQSNRFPLDHLLGTEMTFPGPATHDGVLPRHRERGGRSLDTVNGMLADLHTFDPNTFKSEGQTGKHGYWHDDMLWYGPAGIGSSYRWEGFVSDHRAAFLRAFPDRKGGNHFCRIGDGDYAAISGWPSMTMTHKGDYLGVKATNRALTLRVMDFYRCADGKIMENWVLLDYVELFHQMGVDLIAKSNGLSRS